MIGKKLKMKLLFLLFVCTLCQAQEVSIFWQGIARPAPFGKPFWADMHSTLIRAEIAYATNSLDYDWGDFGTSNRFYVFANLGADIPIWSGNFMGGKYGLGLTLPFMIDVWLDRFEFEPSPVINTSYRFGAFDIGFIYRLDSPLSVFSGFNIYNWALKLSLFKHESTHIGDELTIHRKDLGIPIKRIDVAYNYAELIFTLNDPDSQARLNHGFKVGFLFDYGMKGGWYSAFDSEADADLVKRSRFPFEFYLQYQYQSALFSRGFQVIASLEYRLREQYNYPFYNSGSSDPLQPSSSSNDLVNCFNLFAGIRFDNQKSNYFSKIGIGIRYYYGINPYGQFRSMPHYSQLGMAVLFE
jgi:hypothetical protein